MMKLRHSWILALFACGTAAAMAPVPPAAVPPESLKAVTVVLPKGWTASAKGATLVVRREKKVGLWNPIGAPLRVDDTPPTPLVIEPYEITLRFRPRVTAEKYEELAKENKATQRKLEAMRRTMRQAGISHKFDDWLPSTPEQKKLVMDYRAAQKALPSHRLPDLYTDTHSIDLSDSIRFPLSFTDADEAKECARVKDTIRRLFKLHAP